MDDLRLAVDCLPRATRVAMLDGLAGNDIIVGAYSNGDGICPMLAAHRAGGRTNFIGFAEAWDRFAQRSVSTRRARRASERELLILRTYLQTSLLEEEAGASTMAGAIAEHGELAARSAAERTARTAAQRAAERTARTAAQRAAERAARTAARRAAERGAGRERTRRARPGDADRSRELRGAGGWAWTRVFRRYDDYERALARLARETAGARNPDAGAERTPNPV